MSRFTRMARLWLDFVVGDDWRLALGSTVVIGALWALAHQGMDVWWCMPALIAGLLTLSVTSATRSRQP
jgi:hypothetical protein